MWPIVLFALTPPELDPEPEPPEGAWVVVVVVVVVVAAVAPMPHTGFRELHPVMDVEAPFWKRHF